MLPDRSIFNGRVNSIPPPSVSVITVTYNAGTLIEDTLRAVADLRYERLEHVICDGGSTDATLDVIKKLGNGRVKLFSQSDKGIYDAMNIGLSKTKSDYVWFLNAGDYPFSSRVLEPLEGLENLPDFFYGGTALKETNGSIRRVLEAKDCLVWEDMIYGMAVCHQSIIFKRSIVDFYDLNYPCVADQKWILNAVKRSKSYYRLDGPLSSYMMGGLSEKKYIEFCLEKIRYIFNEHDRLRFIGALIYVFFQLQRHFASRIIRSFNPPR